MKAKRPTPSLVIIILTFNSAEVIEKTITAAAKTSARIVTVDSGSTDTTREIAERLGSVIVQRPFKHYADQRNWAIKEYGEEAEWQLHLDADEVLDSEAINSIRTAIDAPGDISGFMLKRLTYFMGKQLRFGGANSWHMRLFRCGCGTCEDRLYDQHFLCSGKLKQLKGYMHDLNVSSLTEWTSRHNRWSDMEAIELNLGRSSNAEQLKSRLSTDPRERRRFYKGSYYSAPLLIRPLLYFIFRYFVQLGFLDGKVGFIYASLQAFWFRVLVDAKILEIKRRSAE